MNSKQRRAYARKQAAARSGWPLVHDRCTDRWYLQGLSWRSDVERTLNGWRERAWVRLGLPAGARRYWNIQVTDRMSCSQPAICNIPYGTPEERERIRGVKTDATLFPTIADEEVGLPNWERMRAALAKLPEMGPTDLKRMPVEQHFEGHPMYTHHTQYKGTILVMSSDGAGAPDVEPLFTDELYPQPEPPATAERSVWYGDGPADE